MTATDNYIITAADNRYYKNIRQLIYSYFRVREYENSQLLIYDLGLSENQVDEINQLSTRYDFIEFFLFDYSNYPEFVKPEHNHYSWKPIIINKASSQFNGNFLWMDSANCILKKLDPIWKKIEVNYAYSPISGSGTLKEWTVQATLDYLNVPPHYYTKPNRAGNTFGFSNLNSVMKELIGRWQDLALIPECIRPEGANRKNHRDDQSLLTILLIEQEEKKNLLLTRDEVNISTSKPTPYISVRNQFPAGISLKTGIIAHYYFLILRAVDILINKLKGN